MTDINKLRTEIDRIDDQISGIFSQRMVLVAEIAKYKAANNLPVFDSLREEKILARLTAGQDKAMADYIKALFTAIFEISRAYQERNRK